MALTQEQWDRFLPTLKNRNCCLLIGPEIASIRTGETQSSVLEIFSEYMRKRLDEEQIPYNPAINNPNYRASRFIAQHYPSDRQDQFYDEIERFFNSYIQPTNGYFNRLARLPFSSIVNMVPDNFVARSLREQGYEFVEEVYNYSNQAKSNPTIAVEMQLIYYIFGRYDIPESVAVTEKNQLNQIRNMVAGKPSIPDNILTRFADKNKSFLFLGFNFDDWYFRLVIEALGIPKPRQSYYPAYSNTHQTALLAKEYYTEKYGVEFVDPNTDTFIDEMINRYEVAYGTTDRKLLVVLDFHEHDSEFFSEMKRQLKLNIIQNRVYFWDKNDIDPGGLVTSIDDMASRADVYVPFLGSLYLSERASVDRINACLQQPHTSVVPILAGFAAFDAVLPDLRKRALMILPQDNTPLSAFTVTRLPEICQTLASIINRIVR